MSRVNVDYEDLRRFKAVLDQNAQRFEEIRDKIGNAINETIDLDWQDQKSEQFHDRYFGKSYNDINKLVNTMREFSVFLDGKIQILEQYHATNINFN